MIEDKLITLFRRYLSGFRQQDISAVQACYLVPCTLSTPDQMMVISDDKQLTASFIAIFEQLKMADVCQIKALAFSYSQVDSQILLVCIDWAFIDNQGEIFTDFSAFYHLVITEDNYRIFSVNSQELSQSQVLSKKINIDQLNVW